MNLKEYLDGIENVCIDVSISGAYYSAYYGNSSYVPERLYNTKIDFVWSDGDILFIVVDMEDALWEDLEK